MSVCCQICNGILVGGLFKAYPSSSPLTHCLLWAVGTFHVVVDTSLSGRVGTMRGLLGLAS